MAAVLPVGDAGSGELGTVSFSMMNLSLLTGVLKWLSIPCRKNSGLPSVESRHSAFAGIHTPSSITKVLIKVYRKSTCGKQGLHFFSILTRPEKNGCTAPLNMLMQIIII
ncbi:hypothetical protein [Desulfococcus sp.]|uniref:hypothetical protein n=1 Tax=Desulfococcus sp. TaxID=2025834 RepID=UPI003593ACAE